MSVCVGGGGGIEVNPILHAQKIAMCFTVVSKHAN